MTPEKQVTLWDVVRALRARVDAHIAEGGDQQRVDVHDATDEEGCRVAWGGTLAALRDALAAEQYTLWWLADAIDIFGLRREDLDETPYLRVRPALPLETIATAALRVDLTAEVWTLPRPARHHVLLQAYHLAHRARGAYFAVTQGFVTSKGRFVPRDEALVLARAAGFPRRCSRARWSRWRKSKRD